MISFAVSPTTPWLTVFMVQTICTDRINIDPHPTNRKLHRDRSLMMTINGILPGSLPSRSREALVNGVSAAGAVTTRDVLCPAFAILPVTRRNRTQTISDRWRSLGDQQYPVQQQLYASQSRINANAAGAA
jgi:hypothetical protein